VSCVASGPSLTPRPTAGSPRADLRARTSRLRKRPNADDSRSLKNLDLSTTSRSAGRTHHREPGRAARVPGCRFIDWVAVRRTECGARDADFSWRGGEACSAFDLHQRTAEISTYPTDEFGVQTLMSTNPITVTETTPLDHDVTLVERRYQLPIPARAPNCAAALGFFRLSPSDAAIER
jgi:hypothetical protein